MWEGPAAGLPWIPRDTCIYLLSSCLYFLDVMTQMFLFLKSLVHLFFLCCLCCGVLPKKALPDAVWWRFISICSSKNFIA